MTATEEERKENAEQPAEVAEIPVQPESVEVLQQQLQEEKLKAAEHYDQYLRAVAELRNYKKRVEQEREQLTQEANAGLIARLLPVLDDFGRAMSLLPDEKLLHFSWIEGIALIYRRLQTVLEQHGLRPVEALGQHFDPRLHEAVLFEEVPAEQDQVILGELQKGYKLHERLLRPALVKVGKAAAAPQTETAPETEPAPER